MKKKFAIVALFLAMVSSAYALEETIMVSSGVPSSRTDLGLKDCEDWILSFAAKQQWAAIPKAPTQEFDLQYDFRAGSPQLGSGTYKQGVCVITVAPGVAYLPTQN